VLCSPTECPRCASPIVEGTLLDCDGSALEDYKFFDIDIEEQDIVLIDEPALLEAQNFIGACERCSEIAELPFDQVLDALTGCDPTVTEYLLCRPAKCGSCEHDVLEKTLIVAR
jgi:hypothetical protein